MVRKLIFMIILVAIAFVLCACDSIDNRLRVCIGSNSSRLGCIHVPLRDGYTFAEDSYDIEETNIGYDIVVHVVKATE